MTSNSVLRALEVSMKILLMLVLASNVMTNLSVLFPIQLSLVLVLRLIPTFAPPVIQVITPTPEVYVPSVRHKRTA
jgi:hypothetical protein